MAIVGEAHVIVRAITTGFQKDIDDAMSGITSKAKTAGASLGKAFSGGASGGLSKLDQQALDTYKSINRLIEGSYYMSAAVASLLPVVTDLVGGLFALGAQAAAAAPALIVFPSLFSAMAQAAITAKLALGGVFKAVGEIGKAKTPAVDQMPRKLEAFRDAQERVRRAQEALNRAYRAAEERLQQLGFDTEDAVLGQQRAALALEDARNTLARVQDLPPNSRARQEAELAFKEADLNYRRAIDRSNDLTEEQDRVTQNGTLNAEEQVNQSEEVLRAQEELRKSVLNLKKAQDELNKSQTSGGGASEFSKLSKEAQAFAKYLADLKPEIQALKDAAGKEMFGPLQEAIQNLVDNFFPRLKPLLQETGKAFGETMLEFSKIVTAENNLRNFETVGRTNVDTIGKFGKVMGNLYSAFLSLLVAADPLIRRFTDWVVVLTDGWKNAEILKNEGGKLTGVFDQAGDVAAQFGDIIGTLGSAFMDMGKAAAGPGSGGQLILDYFEKAAKKFKDFTSAGLKDGSLEQYFKDVAANFTKVLDIIGKIAGAFAKVGGKKGTGDFLDSIGKSVDILAPALEKLTDGGAGGAFGKFIEQIAELLANTTESGSLKVYFNILTTALGLLNDILKNPIAGEILKVVAAVHGGRLAFSRLGSTINTAKEYIGGSITSFKDLYSKTSNVRDGFKYARKQGTGFFGSLKAGLTNSAAFQKVFGQNSKVLSTYQTGLNKGKTALTGLKNGANKAKTAVTGMASAVKKSALTGLKNGADKAKTAVTGLGKAIKKSTLFTKLASAATKAWTAVQAVFNIVMAANPVVLIILAIAALIAIVVAAYFRFQWFRNFVDGVFDAIGAGLSFIWNNIIQPIFNAMVTVFSLVWQGIQIAFTAVWEAIQWAISWVWENIIQPVFNAIGAVFAAVWGGIQTAFSAVWGAIQTAISFVWENIIRPVFNAIGRVFENIWTGIRNAFTGAWDFITNTIRGAQRLFGRIGDAIQNAFRAAINFIIRAWNGIEFTVPAVKVAGRTLIPGFTLGLPDIPELAEGGVINPTPGGTLARIGEAGRAERVEPLDPDGLSRRDKAIISMLSGGAAGGATINVYPSPGMNEVELAALVNRQLAFELRKGAA
jgi:phage-related protein